MKTRVSKRRFQLIAIDEKAKTLRFNSSGKAIVPIERRTKEALYSAVIPDSTGFTVQGEIRRREEDRHATHDNLYIKEYLSWDRNPQMKERLGWDSDIVTEIYCEKTI